MLGHDLRSGRINSYSEKLSDVSSEGYVLDNHLHHSFETDNSTEIIESLRQRFFWCKSSGDEISVLFASSEFDTDRLKVGISEHMHASWCLLLWQLSVFDHEGCRQICSQNTSSATQYAHEVRVSPRAASWFSPYNPLIFSA